MVFSKKPLHFIIVTLIVILPFLGNANETNTLPVKTEFSIEDKDNIAPRVKLDAMFFYYYVIN